MSSTTDPCVNPSASIIVGNAFRHGGTGCFDLMTDWRSLPGNVQGEHCVSMCTWNVLCFAELVALEDERIETEHARKAKRVKFVDEVEE